jgi:ATP-dependent helicase/DNAse subunit B
MKLAGFYIQTILLPPEANEKNPEEARKKDLKLRGYTNNNIDIMSELDSTYQDSSYIASLGLTKEGEFKKSSKVLSDKEIEETINKTDNIIKQAVTKIENVDFTITPVKVINNGKLVENGCDYCNYRDICFVNNGNQRAIYKKTEKEGEIDETN